MRADKNASHPCRSKSDSLTVHNAYMEPLEDIKLSSLPRSSSHDISSSHSTPHTDTGTSNLDTGSWPGRGLCMHMLMCYWCVCVCVCVRACVHACVCTTTKHPVFNVDFLRK